MANRNEINFIGRLISLVLIYGIFITQMPLVAQNNGKNFSNEEKVFLGYFNQTRLTTKLGVWTDLHHRTINDFAREPHQSIGRTALTFYFNDNLRIMAGYAFVYNHHNSQNLIARIEHRSWQQLFFKTHYGNIHSVQMLRLEERYLQVINGNSATDDFTNINRIRYSHLFQIPFSKQSINKGSLFGVLGNEVFISFGKNVRANVFDQNRFFAGLGYQFSKSNSLHVGYMNIIQQLQNGYDFINSHCVRIFLFQNFDLRKEK